MIFKMISHSQRDISTAAGARTPDRVYRAPRRDFDNCPAARRHRAAIHLPSSLMGLYARIIMIIYHFAASFSPTGTVTASNDKILQCKHNNA